MKTIPILIIGLCLTAFTGCASARQRQAATLAASFGTPMAIVHAMERGERLSNDEIATLARAGFPDEETLLYLQSGNAVYSLKTAQIDELRAAGVSDPVIDYMLSTPQRGNSARALWPGQRNNRWCRGHTRGVH